MCRPARLAAHRATSAMLAALTLGHADRKSVASSSFGSSLSGSWTRTLGVAIIAIAVSLVRITKAHKGAAHLGQEVWLCAIFGAVLIFGAYLFRDFLRAGTICDEPIPFAVAWRRTPAIVRVPLAVMLLGVGLYGLVLLGYAAGIN